MTTPAVQALSAAKISFRMHAYEHAPAGDLSYGEEIARLRVVMQGLDSLASRATLAYVNAPFDDGRSHT